MATSKSTWHDRARRAVEALSADPECRGTDAARREWLMGRRPSPFSSGYPAQVWKYEVDRATGRGSPDAILVHRGWPMTEAQKAFFGE